jgi:hypothetical protein
MGSFDLDANALAIAWVDQAFRRYRDDEDPQATNARTAIGRKDKTYSPRSA